MSQAATPLLRLAEASDGDLVFRWRNDPWIVSLSTSRREVTREEHRSWFGSALDRDRHLLFIVLSEGQTPAGTVRLDLVDAAAVLTIYLLRPFTGRALGPRAIEEACRAGFAHWPQLMQIEAYVRSENLPSIKTFRRTGFEVAGVEGDGESQHVRMLRRKEQA